jgi:alkanesulfonate monooxygenase SsuD/methylene tetrahydromethanopterin reductase-like flavin-dependent oxidoreductase (luciferase family)
VDQILTYTAAGTPAEVRDYLDGFIKQTEADELMTLHNALTPEARLHSVTLLAETMQ